MFDFRSESANESEFAGVPAGHFLPREFESNELPPSIIVGYASFRSAGGTSIFDLNRIPQSIEPFYGSESDRAEAMRALEASGLVVLAESRIGCSVAGPPEAFEELTGGTIVARERLMHASAGRLRYVTHLDLVGEGQPSALGLGTPRTDATQIEGIVLERPRMPLAIFPSPLPPAVSKFHLRVPDDVALILNAHSAHRQGRIGSGIEVAMIDSGQYAHPFFAAHHYRVRPPRAMVPGTNPAKDPVGHGTGESANIFAAAPGAVLQPIRVSDSQGNLVAVIAGLQAAKAANPRPRIISNSWGGDLNWPPDPDPPAEEQAIVIEILDAIQQGIVVVFSAGNGQFSVEPQIPGVISAGGAYLGPGHVLQASNYASSYDSPWFNDVQVPTVCGLVGLRPRAQYLMLPVPPACEIDAEESQSQQTPPDPADGTQGNDGWALFSGTSAAAPQVAGVCALILGARPHLTPEQVRQCLVATAVDVVGGRTQFGDLAVPGPDLATGAGLINAGAAVQYAIANFP